MPKKVVAHLQDPTAATLFEVAMSALELALQKDGPQAREYSAVSDVLVDLAYELEERGSGCHA